MRIADQIRVDTDGKGQGHRYHIIYDKAGKEVHIGQLEDALSAIRTGAYTATKPPDKK